jgi:hypothetical protein
MTQMVLPELVGTLEKAKTQMKESVQKAVQDGQLDWAQSMIQKMKDLDEMIGSLPQNDSGPVPHTPDRAPIREPNERPDELPYYYTEGNRLVKVGPSRDGATYKHRVIREHFDQMIDALANLAGKNKEFETAAITSALNIPKHEPLIILAVLNRQKLLYKVRRDRWYFVKPETFRTDAKRVWSALPRS